MAIKNTERLSLLFHRELKGKKVLLDVENPSNRDLDLICRAMKHMHDAGATLLELSTSSGAPRRTGSRYQPPDLLQRYDRAYLLTEQGGVPKAHKRDEVMPWLSNNEMKEILTHRNDQSIDGIAAATRRRMADALTLLDRKYSPTVTIIRPDQLLADISETSGRGTECFLSHNLRLRHVTPEQCSLRDALWDAYGFVPRSPKETSLMESNSYVIGAEGSGRIFGGVSIIPNDTDANGVPHSAELARVFGAGMGKHIIRRAVALAYTILDVEKNPDAVIFAVTDQPNVAKSFQACGFTRYNSLRDLQKTHRTLPDRLKNYPWTDAKEDRLVLEYPCCLGKLPEHP